MSYIFNYPMETDEAFAFWSSDHKCNTAQAFIAFSLDENDFRELAKRHGYTRTWRNRMWSAFGHLVNQPDMQGVGFELKGTDVKYWECMPLVEDSLPKALPNLQMQSTSRDVDLESGESITLQTIWNQEDTIQWYKNGTMLAATGPSLEVDISSESNLGTFTSVATNSVGSATSKPIVIAVKKSNPVITLNPESLSAEDGDVVTFSANATGYDSVKWYKNNQEVSSTGTSYSYTTTKLSDGDYVFAKFTNSIGSSTTTSGRVKIEAVHPIITKDPESIKELMSSYQPYTFTSEGLNALSYQWYIQEKGVYSPIAGAVSKDLTTSYDATEEPNSIALGYRVTYIGKNSTTTSRTANVYISTDEAPFGPPVIVTQPQASTVYALEDGVFTINATHESNELFYLWQVQKGTNGQWVNGGTMGEGATTSTYTFPTSHTTYGYRVRCRVRGQQNTSEMEVLSDTAELYVDLQPATITQQPQSLAVTDGEEMRFEITATHPQSDDISYQWYQDDILVPGETGTAYVFTPMLGDSGEEVYCRVRPYDNSASAETFSDKATITVIPNEIWYYSDIFTDGPGVALENGDVNILVISRGLSAHRIDNPGVGLYKVSGINEGDLGDVVFVSENNWGGELKVPVGKFSSYIRITGEFDDIGFKRSYTGPTENDVWLRNISISKVSEKEETGTHLLDPAVNSSQFGYFRRFTTLGNLSPLDVGTEVIEELRTSSDNASLLCWMTEEPTQPGIGIRYDSIEFPLRASAGIYRGKDPLLIDYVGAAAKADTNMAVDIYPLTWEGLGLSSTTRPYYEPAYPGYITLPTMALRGSSNFVKFKFRSPTTASGNYMAIAHNNAASNSISLEVNESNAFIVSNRATFTLDGVRLIGGMTFPIDGQVHEIIISGDGYGQFGRLGARHDGTKISRLVYWDVECRNSDAGDFFFPLDEGTGSTVYDYVQDKKGTLTSFDEAGWVDGGRL